ncbi:MAG: MFS transporter, partial [Gammaproteobacteria bacterium]
MVEKTEANPAPRPESRGIVAALSVFRIRDYRFLWGAMFAASLVTWFRILGTSQWLLDATGSALAVGAIGVIQLVVQIPTLLWGGALADRVDRKRLMTAAHGTTCLSLLTLAGLNGAGLLTPLLVYAGIAVTAASQMLASPARSALVPAVVPHPELLRANAVDTASQNIAAIVGPLLFAAPSLAAGPTVAFFVAALLAATAAALPNGIRASGRAVPGSAGTPAGRAPSTLALAQEGLRYVRHHPILPGL